MIECHLLGIDSMLEFAHRAFENWNADDTKTFHVSYDDMNLLDFAICDLERRVKDLRASLQNA